ncbi:MAG: 50S ribosomal protein L21 [bacterium]|nr:50S ribosomal protein L21 [bacterium]
MKYAIIRIGGKQYRVSEGENLEVEKLPLEKDKEAVFEEVLLLADDKEVKIGKPFVKDVKVKALVLDQKKGEKIRVAKFKSKVRYRRVRGFRPQITVLKIEKIITPLTSVKRTNKIE